MTLCLDKAQIKEWKLQQLDKGIQKICPLCQRPLSFFKEANVVVDHDHDTGFIRGLLCRTCNSQEGYVNKVLKSSVKYDDLQHRLHQLTVLRKTIACRTKVGGPAQAVLKYAYKATRTLPTMNRKKEAMDWLHRLGSYWLYHEEPRVDLKYGREDFKKEK